MTLRPEFLYFIYYFKQFKLMSKDRIFELVNFVAATRRGFDKGMFPERCRRIGRLPNILTGDCECNPFFMCREEPKKRGTKSVPLLVIQIELFTSSCSCRFFYAPFEVVSFVDNNIEDVAVILYCKCVIHKSKTLLFIRYLSCSVNSNSCLV